MQNNTSLTETPPSITLNFLPSPTPASPAATPHPYNKELRHLKELLSSPKGQHPPRVYQNIERVRRGTQLTVFALASNCYLRVAS